MSKKKPIIIKIRKNLLVEPEDIYIAKVIKSGNGAIIKSYKKYINKEAVIIMAKKIRTQEDEDVSDATEMAYEFKDKKEDKDREDD